MTSRVDFWSSTEYSTFLPALTGALGAQGWTARARFTVSEAAYRGALGRAARLALRARSYGLYPLQLAAAVRKADRPEVAVVCTNTFFAPRVAQLCGDVPVVHWVFDLFPDVLVVAGKLRDGSALERWMRRLARQTCERAAVNVFLGEHLRRHAEARFGAIPRTVVIPVGADTAPFAAGVRPREEGAPLQILYCGNLGRMHDTATISRALRESPNGRPTDRPAIQWSFRGNGVGFRELATALAGRGDCPFGPSFPPAEWVEAMRSAAVALVTVRPGAEGLVMPSKTYSAMAAGQAILAVCPRASDLADTVLRHACGWVVEPGDSAGLRAGLTEIVRDGGGLQAKREAAWRAAREFYGAEALAPQWARVLEQARGWKRQS